jgi:hypothetical protein
MCGEEVTDPTPAPSPTWGGETLAIRANLYNSQKEEDVFKFQLEHIFLWLFIK